MLHPERRWQNREAIDLMDKIEKIKQGVTCCERTNCHKCPYKGEKDETYPGFCRHVLDADIISVIEEQQHLLYSYKNACQLCKSRRLEGVKPF